MTELTRRSVLAATGASLALAGCLTDTPDGSGGEKSTERTTTRSPPTGKHETETTPDETPATGETTGDWVERLSNEPEPNHGVSIENEATVPATLRVEVVREATGETVFETTRRVRPGSEVAVYNLREAEPEGVERFEVCAELVESGGTETGTATATTSETTTAADSITATATSESATASETATDATTAPPTTGTAAATDPETTTDSETTTAETDRRDCATIATNECYGSAYARVADDGSVQLVYAIC